MAWTLAASNVEPRIRYGVNTHFGQNLSQYTTDIGAVLDAAAVLGVNGIRDSIGWSRFEAVAGVYTFNPTGDTYSQKIFAALAYNQSNNLGLHLTLNCSYGNPAVYGSPTHPDPTWRDHFVDAYEAAATSYLAEGYDPSMLTLECWNEPTNTAFNTIFDAANEADDLALMSQELYARIKAVDPAIRVIAPATDDSFWHYGVDGWPQAYWAESGWSNTDAYSEHLYYVGGGASLRYPEYMFRRAYDLGWLDNLYAAGVTDGNSTLPLVLNEFGWDATTFGTDGAKYSSRGLAIYSCFPRCIEVSFYELVNSTASAWGALSSPALTRTVRGVAIYPTLPHLKWATQRHYFRTSTYDAGHHAVLLIRPGSQRLIIWSLAGSEAANVNVYCPGAGGTLSTQILDTDGASITTDALSSGNNTISVDLTDTAVALYADTPIVFTELLARPENVRITG